MNKALRKVVIAGNWKMNKNAEETKVLLSEINAKLPETDAEILLCVPDINIETAVKATENSPVHIGAQNCHWAESGAFTGETSANMLESFGVKHAIIGHSERRQYFGETDKTVNQRALTCLAHDITPVICVGETLEARKSGITNSVINTQVQNGIQDFSIEQIKHTIIAYEPIWAIGTGETATSAQAEEVCAYIRQILTELYDAETAQSVSILYGGSMNAKNAKELLSMENIDGGLIGGASLKPDDFTTIISYAE